MGKTKRRYAFGGESDITSEGGRSQRPPAYTSGALERFMARRARMSEGGQVQDSRALPDRPRYQPPPDEPMGRTMKRDAPIPRGSLPVYQGDDRKKMAQGGAVEPVWDPLDEQDAEYLDEQDESKRHADSFLRAFAGAIAKASTGRR